MSERKLRIDEVCELVGGSAPSAAMGEERLLFPAPIDRAGENSISFCSKKNLEDAVAMINASGASVVICSGEIGIDPEGFDGKIIIIVPNPRMAFIKVMQRYFEEKILPGIAASATIHPGASIHPGAHVGPNTFIGKSEIAEGAVIQGNVTIYSNVTVGKRVTIKSGAVIGADGYGYERDENGEFLKFPNVGGVVIEDDVDIGSNTCVDRGTLGNTRIGKGSKVDNLCHVAHNVDVGRHCTIIAQCMIGGSVVIGDYSWIAPSACIRDGVKIGRNATVGLGAVVTKDVPDNAVVMGVPAKTIRENPIHEYLKDAE